MYKTIWLIEYGTNKMTVTYYHFKKNPQLPYPITEMENISIEWSHTLKLCNTIKIFWKCLTHNLSIK